MLRKSLNRNCVGGIWYASARAWRFNFGFLRTENPGIDFFALFGSGATFRHIAVGSREGLQEVARAIAMARIKPVVDRVFEFENAKEAFTHLDSGSHFGKVVIKCSTAAPV
jgi:NADPH:quinone reductase-like Zn-dependent oxidoreductase